MRLSKKPTNTAYVTYKWLLTTIISAMAGILMIVGALANATFFTKAAGAAVEEKIISGDKRLNDMQEMLKEVRQDVKIILVSKRK